MIVDLFQRKKEMTTADFEIVKNNEVLGNMHVEGKLFTRDGIMNGEYNGTKFLLKSIPHFESGKYYRPYSIQINDLNVGSVYQVEVKTGLFTNMCYHHLEINSETFKLYCIGLGKDGIACCLYSGDKQIALIEKDNIIYDDLHHYHIYTQDENPILVALLYCFYMYVLTCFNSQTKVKKSVKKTYSLSTNKKLKEKYNPEFKNKCIN